MKTSRLPLRTNLALVLTLFLSTLALRADPPAGYYDSATGLTGPALQAALHEIINDHAIIPYSSTATDTSDALKVLDEDPGNSSNVWLLYAQRTEPKSTFGLSTGWNREHQWCNSYGLDDVQPAYSDLHNLRAEDANVNSSRGNEPYDYSDPADPGYVDPAHIEAPLCTSDSDSWQPPVNVRGDIARSLFYMDIRYEGDRANEPDLILTTNLALISATANYMGSLTVLLQWHQDDPVDAAEMLRNDRIYSLYQGNRNPFVDHPGWVAEIFGGAPPAPTAPSIVTQPQDRSVLAGANVTFSVVATGSAPLAYQWHFNSVAIPAATNSAYTLTGVQAGDAGVYSILVANAHGSVLSSNATLTITSGEPLTLAQWNFNSSSPDANTGTGSTSASTGTGTASLVGVTATFAAGSAADPAASGTDNSGWNTASYPAQSAGNKTAGVKFAVNTTGYRNVVISWDQRLSNTASKYARLQYTTDGVNFVDAGVINISVGSAFEFQSQDLSAITGINDNPNFAFRIVSEFQTTATGSGTAGYVTASTSSYGTSGTVRFDLVTVTATPNPVTLPDAPVDLVATAGDAQVTLSWSASANATIYNLKRATSTGGPYITIATIAATSTVDPGLSNGTTYYYVVSAVNSVGESSDSNEASATPLTPPPAAPTALVATGGNAVVNLTWSQSASPGIAQNQVYRSTTGSGGPYSLLATLAATTSYADSAVANGNTYFYTVTAVNPGGESDPSAYSGATPSCPLPSAPLGLAATAGNAQVALSWASVAGATSYQVKRASVSGGPYTVLASGVTAVNYADATAANGTTYYYVVSAVNACGEGANSTQVSATPAAPQVPAAPTNLTASAGKRKITLNWTDNATTETSFRVERSLNGTSFTTVTTVAANLTSYTQNGLTSGTRYYYRVFAVNANGDSTASNTASAVAK
jgi:endonuclease I/fibronectin type 3 domain-containing protein